MPFRKKWGNSKLLIDRSSNERQRIRKAITDIGNGKVLPEKITKYEDNDNAVQVSQTDKLYILNITIVCS